VAANEQRLDAVFGVVEETKWVHARIGDRIRLSLEFRDADVGRCAAAGSFNPILPRGNVLGIRGGRVAVTLKPMAKAHASGGTAHGPPGISAILGFCEGARLLVSGPVVGLGRITRAVQTGNKAVQGAFCKQMGIGFICGSSTDQEAQQSQ